MLLGPRSERDRARRRVAHDHGVLEDRPHALVRLERLALDDADGSEQPEQLWIAGPCRVLLDQPSTTSQYEKSFGGIVLNTTPDPSTNRVCSRGCGGGERRTTGEEGRDRRAFVTRDVRGDADPVADRIDRDRGVVVDHEGPAKHADAGRAGVRHMEPAVGQRAVVARPDEQVAPALRPVRARQAEVRHPPEPHVVDRAEDARRGPERRDVQHLRPGAEIDEAEEVDRVAVPVRNSEAESIRSENSRIVSSSAPIEWKPSRIAATDAPG